MKKLYKSEENKVFAGIIGGIGEYSGVDLSILRVMRNILVAFTGFIPGIIAYLIAVFIVPKKPK